MTGKVYLVGAGPGKADLITVRGLEILRQAEVVIYDYLVDKRILEETRPDAELICCDKLAKKGRYSDGFLIHQEKIHDLVVKKAREGKKVIRLKNGDPCLFSRTSSELEELVKNGIDFEVVPGVTAASAASAYSGIPLTDRRYASNCVFVTGHQDPAKKGDSSTLNWKYLAHCGTIVLYMAFENLNKIVKELLRAGKEPDEPCALIQDASLVTQKLVVGTLRDIVLKARRQGIKPPVIIIIGSVVKLEKRFNWLKRKRKILFTGLSKERFFFKDVYLHLPLIKIVPLLRYVEFDANLKNIAEFDWLIFTSRFGVKYLFERLKILGLDARNLKGIEIAAIGNSTKNELLRCGICPDLTPKEESSIGLLKEFKKLSLKNKNIFLPRSDLSDKGLTSGLKKLGARVKASVAYRNIMPSDLPDLDLKGFDEIMFSSPSGVRNFAKRYVTIPKGVKINYIGEVTKKELKKHHLV